VLKVQEIPSGYDASQYATERLMVPARDGKQVPVSIVYPEGFEKNGEGKLFLYAYGAYGMRSRRASRPPGSACSTAATPSPSPISAAATISAINGSSTASSKSGPTPSRLRRRGKRADRRRLHPAGRIADPGRLGRRQADGRGRQHRSRSCGARWSPTCPSSMCSTRCSTTPAADAGRVAGMGQSDHRQGGVRYIRSYSPYDNVRAKPIRRC
jgi:oligopeptidase B